MSTRCQIEFKVKGTNGSVLIYRHSDGYPEDVIETLEEFFKWNRGRSDDLEYMTANFILFEKLSMIANMNHWAKKSDNREVETVESILDSNRPVDSYWLLGYGICQPNDEYGDIEFFYNVTINEDGTASIKVRNRRKGSVIKKHKVVA